MGTYGRTDGKVGRNRKEKVETRPDRKPTRPVVRLETHTEEDGSEARSTNSEPEESRDGRACSAEYNYGGEMDEAKPDRAEPIRTGVEPARSEAEVRKVGAGQCRRAE
jgi:hypothetical protein